MRVLSKVVCLKIGTRKLRRVCVNNVFLILLFSNLDQVFHLSVELESIGTQLDSSQEEGGGEAFLFLEKVVFLFFFLDQGLREDLL